MTTPAMDNHAMTHPERRTIEVNGRSYRLPSQPTVVVCVDGCDPDYISQAVAGGHMPWMQRTLASGSAVLAFAAAGIIFGLAHIYQGRAGVAATTIVGFLLAAIYLASGSLAAPIAIHVLLDIVGLVIRPTLARLAARR